MRRLSAVELFFVVCICLVSVAGCSSSSGPTGTISGKLMLNGNPAPAGTQVQFLSASGAAGATVAADGSFTIMGAPVGSYSVAVSPAAGSSGTQVSPEEAMKKTAGTTPGGKGSDPTAFAADKTIPAKYRDAATSGVSFTVKEGNNDFMLDMK